MNNKTIRWQQRFENLTKAYGQLKNNLNIAKPNEAEQQGIIKSFEFTFELSWKTLKDYLESQGVIALSPREVIKQAFHLEFLQDGDIWIEMLENRNLMAHTYNEQYATKALNLIKAHYFTSISHLIIFFESKISSDR